MKTKAICTAKGCNKTPKARGVCAMHNYRLKKYSSLELPKKLTLKERFLKKVDKNGPVHPVYGQCWTWVGKGASSYVAKSVGIGSAIPLAKVSWIAHFGEVGRGIYVNRKCKNRSCANPDHLFLGTWSGQLPPDSIPNQEMGKQK